MLLDAQGLLCSALMLLLSLVVIPFVLLAVVVRTLMHMGWELGRYAT